jgi:arabinose-5-phosphate isomerase
MVCDRGRLTGVVTAGDLTRMANRAADFLARPAAEAMTGTPRTTTPDALAAAVTGEMERVGIMAMPVLDGEYAPVGVVHLHDLMRAGAV